MKQVVVLEDIVKDGWRIFEDMDKEYLLVAKEDKRALLRTYECGNTIYSVIHEYERKDSKGSQASHVPDSFAEWLGQKVYPFPHAPQAHQA